MKKSILKGTLFVTGASLWWGILGVFYFDFVSFASPFELAFHRTIWTALLLIISTTYYCKWSEFNRLIKKPKNLVIFFLTGMLVFINWLTWLYAISINNLLDASLGYYIFPIISVFLGIIFLKKNIIRIRLSL